MWMFLVIMIIVAATGGVPIEPDQDETVPPMTEFSNKGTIEPIRELTKKDTKKLDKKAKWGDTSLQYHSGDSEGKFVFGYHANHKDGGSFRRESSDADGNVIGSYGLRAADGRIRIVNYFANDRGFNAEINTNEQGVDLASAANTLVVKGHTVGGPAEIGTFIPGAKTVILFYSNVPPFLEALGTPDSEETNL
ncbi:cuticle protein 14-like isoform X2 [Limulus polyphemus]|uniref:Cuticle protein 14-like isoform X2 n=1 Tax=Limulus polyphemus TaxID=6850 RepID=A0ABM1S316_LIMPO|nr:cuticle protein 14-like isoform X2 [Limulus polyphemus]